MGGATHCTGTVELKYLGEWRPVEAIEWTRKTATVVCEQLDCGYVVSLGKRTGASSRSVWSISDTCIQLGSTLQYCASASFSTSIFDVTCSGKIICDSIHDIICDSWKRSKLSTNRDWLCSTAYLCFLFLPSSPTGGLLACCCDRCRSRYN